MIRGRKPKKDDIHVTVYQLVILLNNFCTAVADPNIGHNDTDKSIAEVLARYKSARINLTQRDLEDFLYCCNMLHEDGKFWHPTGESFDKFTYDVARNFKFDKQYNRLIPRDQVGIKKELIEDVDTTVDEMEI